MSILWTNNASSVLTGDITAGTLSISVTAGHGDRFPAVAAPHYFMATLVDTSGNREIVKVTARTSGSNTMTIERAQEGTSARSFATGDIVELRITKNAMDHLSKAADINAQHYVCDASAADQGAATNSSSLKSLVDALGATEEATIDLPHTGTGDTTTYTVGTNLTIPATVTLRVHKGARVSPSGGVTLTVNGIIQAGAYTIFAGAGTVTVSTYPQDQAWWGNAQRMDGNFLVQSYDTDLATFSLPANTTISAFAKTLLDDADAAAARATLQIPAASESVAGLAELATQAEVDAGTDDARIVTPKKLYSTPGIYRRNAIINGAMEIAQRGTSFPSAATGQFIVDRFQYVKSGTSAVHTVGQSSDAPTGVGLSNSALLDCTTADTSIDATDYSGILYFVEGYDFARFKDRQAVLSFYVKAPKAGAYCVSFMNSGNDRSYVAEYTVNQPNAWEFKSIPITFNYTGGTWNYTNGRGVGIYWMVACGSTYHTTPGAWQTGIFLATANQVNGLDSTDNDFYITGVQLEKGSVATDFEFRSFATELALCQRYYQVVGGVPGSGPRFAGYVAASWVHTYHLPVTMRAAPTAVKNGTWYVYNCSSPLVSDPSPNCFVLSTTATTPGALEYRPDSSDDTITLSAEF